MAEPLYCGTNACKKKYISRIDWLAFLSADWLIGHFAFCATKDIDTDIYANAIQYFSYATTDGVLNIC